MVFFFFQQVSGKVRWRNIRQNGALSGIVKCTDRPRAIFKRLTWKGVFLGHFFNKVWRKNYFHSFCCVNSEKKKGGFFRSWQPTEDNEISPLFHQRTDKMIAARNSSSLSVSCLCSTKMISSSEVMKVKGTERIVQLYLFNLEFHQQTLRFFEQKLKKTFFFLNDKTTWYQNVPIVAVFAMQFFVKQKKSQKTWWTPTKTKKHVKNTCQRLLLPINLLFINLNTPISSGYILEKLPFPNHWKSPQIRVLQLEFFYKFCKRRKQKASNNL